MIVCWSLKGGSGTTVVSAALALTLAQRSDSAVRIVDIAGDIPSALGIAEPSGEGVTNWLQQPQRAPIQSLQIPVTARVSLLPRVKQFADDHEAVVNVTDTPGGGATVVLTFAN